MLKQGEPFRARAYQKAQETIMTFDGDINCAEDLRNLPGIGSTIMEKLNEYTKTGTLRILEREKNNPINILTDVYGIGPKKAKELVEKGITSIEMLRNRQDLLNDIQKVGLKYYEDILKRIPRSEIDEYNVIFKNSFTNSNPSDSEKSYEIVGSYRRGSQNSGDIDVIITSNDSNTFKRFVDILIQNKIVLEVLSRGPTKCLAICRIGTSQTARRVDFLYTPIEEYPFAILYFTGSKIFNTVMRHRALEMGLTMNEHGLNYKTVSGKGSKVEAVFRTEKDIFDYLNMEFKLPHERTDGRAVIIKTKKEIEVEEPKKTKLIITNDEEIVYTNPNISTNKTVKKREKIGKKTKKNKLQPQSEKIEKNKSIQEHIQDFKQHGIPILQNLHEDVITSVLNEANNSYYNKGISLLTDNEYDIIKEYMEEKYPTNKIIHQIGAEVERNKVQLPYEMWSMDKIKPDTGVLSSWTTKFTGPYILSCKLDGVSGLYTTEGAEPKLYTRGNGKVGQDVSHLIPYLNLPTTKNIAIRGEFIIPKNTFETKYKNKFANPRNMVAGIINQKTISETIVDIHFVAYEVINPVLKPMDQILFLNNIKAESVKSSVSAILSNEILSKLLTKLRESYMYEIDGIIVTDDKIYERKSSNPEHAFAFKMVLTDQIAEAKVVDVIWNPSKDGYLKPRVQIEPISLGGVTITYATGFNGLFIQQNKIGVGAIIEIIRSGDVIPHIRNVIVKAENAKMPDVNYVWNETNVDIMLQDASTDETVLEKNITGFFRGIGVEGLSTGNVNRLIQAKYKSVSEILKMEVNDFLKVDGFKIKTATKLFEGIREKIQNASIITIMSASNLFGRGFSEKKIELIMNSYPDILISSETNEEKINKIANIKGMAQKSAEAFVEKINDFINFMKEAALIDKLNQNSSSISEVNTGDISHPLFSKTIVMTGFRDKELQENLKKIGAKMGTSVSKNTFIVLVKSKEEDTGKVLDEKKLCVPVMTIDEFKQAYIM